MNIRHYIQSKTVRMIGRLLTLMGVSLTFAACYAPAPYEPIPTPNDTNFPTADQANGNPLVEVHGCVMSSVDQQRIPGIEIQFRDSALQPLYRYYPYDCVTYTSTFGEYVLSGSMYDCGRKLLVIATDVDGPANGEYLPDTITVIPRFRDTGVDSYGVAEVLFSLTPAPQPADDTATTDATAAE